MSKADDRIIARAAKLADVQKYVYTLIESLEDYQRQHMRKGRKKDEWIMKRDVSEETINEISCNMGILEVLREIESLCTK